MLWVIMTRGDYLTAPLFHAAITPKDRLSTRAAQRLLFHLNKPRPTGRGGHVFGPLEAFAGVRAEVEQAIGAGASPTP
ncbi:hypothetical protein [Amycolatopsis sp. DG1A-15b]|uniref:hypothetical protein n=1 Tax=Amycolatopsis sp. DG1A-15b TaxID=3052846 RepID=UPI00255B8E0A|nr:hypothetical protein [Amycolatopsis sp. DG1A-15b]WIX90391.1 hypothetical protein QRY02_08155 [Amycolatopsis sp. DG1A-15b]